MLRQAPADQTDPSPLLVPLSNHLDTQLNGAFPATQWTLVNRARQSGDEGAAAVEVLCGRYWFPIYAFLRGKGHAPHDAEDLTQGFFQTVLKDGLFQLAEQERGKLRSLLLTILKRQVANQMTNANAQKRGGGVSIVSFDVSAAEQRYADQPLNTLDPEKIFWKAWAQSVLERAREKLRAVYKKAPRADIATALDPYLDPDEDRVPYREFADRFAMTEGALRLHVYRLRQKLGDLVKEEVRQTVDSPEEFAEELEWLKGALAA